MAVGYFPILKGKRGEFTALARVDPAIRPGVCPLIEVVPVSTTRRPPLSTAAHLNETAERLSQGWGAQPVAIDLRVSDLPDIPGSNHPWAILTTAAAAHSLSVIPTIGPGDSPRRIAAAAAAIATIGTGAVIRVPWTFCAQRTAGQLEAELRRLRHAIGQRRSDIDLVIDQAQIETSPRRRTGALVNTLDPLRDIDRWRNVVCAGTSFPPDISRVPFGTSTHERIEWRIWQRLRTETTRRPAASRWRAIAFGDYGAAAAALPPSRGRTRHPALRYTAGNDIVVLRHEAAAGEGLGAFRDLCETVVDPGVAPVFAGAAHSWGDWQIDRIARSLETPGGGEMWRRIATSHHIATVVGQLATNAWP